MKWHIGGHLIKDHRGERRRRVVDDALWLTQLESFQRRMLRSIVG